MNIISKIKNAFRSESGFSMLEGVIALGLFSLISTAFLVGMGSNTRASILVTEQAQGESIARSQMDAIAAHLYIDYSISGHEEYDLVIAPANYSVAVAVTPINPATGNPLGSGDDGAQKIVVTALHGSRTVFSLEGYKVDR